MYTYIFFFSKYKEHFSSVHFKNKFINVRAVIVKTGSDVSRGFVAVDSCSERGGYGGAQ